jgi:hypothetical protein
MDLYTLTDTFLAKDPVDEFVSAIWTERYSTAGEVQLVVPATKEYIDGLADGTFLALRGSDEVMILENQSIENGLMTVTGSDLLTFLNQRWAWYPTSESPLPDDPSQFIADYTEIAALPGQFIANVVLKMVIAPLPMSTPGAGAATFTQFNLDWDNERIDRLSLGAVDTTGTPKRITIPIGPIYDGIAQIAASEGLGISLYLESADRLAGYSLKFTTYRGVDHTMDGTAPLVRLTPDLDSIQDLKEVRSIQLFKNVVYVFYAGSVTKHLLDPTQPEPTGFDRRVLIRNAEGEPVGHTAQTAYYTGGQMVQSYTRIVVGPADVAAFREQNAKDAFANHNYIQAIDGESSPISDYIYGVHYGLGDVIELEGLTGTISKARVTEFIRSQDKSGEKSYPTISVIT